MKVVILCGGRGWRINEETEFKPKPLITVGGLPILWHIMKFYSHHGYKDFILCLGYKGYMIKDFFMNLDTMGNDFMLKFGMNGSKQISYCNRKKLIDGWKITFVDTGLNTQTGSRVARIKKFIDKKDENFFLTYGDGVSDIDMNEVLKYHKKRGKVATLCGVNYINPFGIIEPKAGLVESFKEKPKSRGLVNGGFYVFNKKIFDYLSTEENCILEKEPMEMLSKDKQLAIYEHRKFWHCVDHMKHLNELNGMYDSGVRPWMIWEKRGNSSKSELS